MSIDICQQLSDNVRLCSVFLACAKVEWVFEAFVCEFLLKSAFSRPSLPPSSSCMEESRRMMPKTAETRRGRWLHSPGTEHWFGTKTVFLEGFWKIGSDARKKHRKGRAAHSNGWREERGGCQLFNQQNGEKKKNGMAGSQGENIVWEALWPAGGWHGRKIKQRKLVL